MITCNECGKISTSTKDIPHGGCRHNKDIKSSITIIVQKDDDRVRDIYSNPCEKCCFNDEEDIREDCPFSHTMVKLGLPSCDEGYVYVLKEV